MKKPSILGKGISLATLKASALVLGPLLTAGIVMGASSAAFTGSYENQGNSWTAGSVSLTGSKATAAFTASNIAPGYTESHCITVTSNASLQTALSFYGTQKSNVNQLAENLQVTVATGSGGVDGSTACTGFTSEQSVFNGTLAALGATNGSAATAIPITKPMPANGGAQQFMITVSLPTSTGNAQQSGSASMDFGWINRS
ncbi:hypothetical protein [Pseudarthrobacter sp. BIM B-2242]|uniref:hypothetical protein n=1 Tax=Pseudarthrobacter sp. BIM B-2242 TaxID=2772401 RepID=UPI00168A9339|nr:hypothetical protein [Pseudarthrobacter sp. BIM B-2242]QOD05793.1 hypothetical protein IDT60_22435 [Pseudarthrobacter sp. BIM B-2242]